ncbi:MAG TPA: zf-HC2 domain-containing protein [Bacillota bacterium]|nr:zf-HC2 domain-containing protein [Bacillota bacterium]
MVSCYDPGDLQAYLDGELDCGAKAELEKHLLHCSKCCRALEEIRENQSFASARLARYMKALAGAEFDTSQAWRRFNKKRLSTGKGSPLIKKGVLSMLAKYRAVATAAAIILALAVTFSIGSVRSAASDLLTIFRVEKVKTINLTPSDLAQIETALREGAGKVDIGNFGKLEFSGGNESGKVTLEEARNAVDFELNLPDVLPGGYQLQEVHKYSAGHMEFTLDTIKTNQVLQSLGSENLLPEELNGRTFVVKSPAQISAAYSDPGNQSVSIWQGRSPELIAPGSDVNTIRDALLALPFLPENLRAQLASINDWEHTFLIPNVGGSSQEVVVNGVPGVFIGQNGSEEQTSCLIWQKAGVVYAVSGQLDLGQALQLIAALD